MQKPKSTFGLRHVALFVKKFEETAHFYQHLLGMRVDWQPDSDNIYLTTGHDNLALHRVKSETNFNEKQRLDHIGFIITEKSEVDVWYEYLKSQQISMKTAPRDHRDGTRSFYCLDPDGNIVQMIWIPSVVGQS